MKTPLMVPHADLIDDLEFMQWCDENYENCDVVGWRRAYEACIKGALTNREAAEILDIHIDSVSRLVRKYDQAAKKYKAERDEKIQNNTL